ncbi:MAG: sigma-70 family RNA polymerase sigma factor [Synergistaceae bacterium]|jgi:RNA polymerase sigma factor (sigma-70 family)|nr:sigma-70 family RNA polymerase sigma factor [Synergistaceae bacterium]MDR1515509.1 sigma-70 family RNA polymerase sigma factor [Synergistaceae bacterium]
MRITKKRVERIIDENAGKIGYYAWKYSRRAGAEEADLRQEGYLALLKLVKKASRQNLNRTISNSLRGMVRDAAFKLYHPEGTVQLSQCDPDDEDGEALLRAEDIADIGVEEDFERLELADAVERPLDGENRRLAELLAENNTHAEIARMFGISRQAVSQRVSKLRERLKNTMSVD